MSSNKSKQFSNFNPHRKSEKPCDIPSCLPTTFQMSKLFTESSRPGVGRVLVASQDISPGQTVLQDDCLVAMPDGLPVCLGCLGPLPLLPHLQVECHSCQWPLCRSV